MPIGRKLNTKVTFSNAASNVGLMNEAREYWNEQPLEYRKKKEKNGKRDTERTGENTLYFK